jgi:hypothetical protein
MDERQGGVLGLVPQVLCCPQRPAEDRHHDGVSEARGQSVDVAHGTGMSHRLREAPHGAGEVVALVGERALRVRCVGPDRSRLHGRLEVSLLLEQGRLEAVATVQVVDHLPGTGRVHGTWGHRRVHAVLHRAEPCDRVHRGRVGEPESGDLDDVPTRAADGQLVLQASRAFQDPRPAVYAEHRVAHEVDADVELFHRQLRGIHLVEQRDDFRQVPGGELGVGCVEHPSRPTGRTWCGAAERATREPRGGARVTDHARTASSGGEGRRELFGRSGWMRAVRVVGSLDRVDGQGCGTAVQRASVLDVEHVDRSRSEEGLFDRELVVDQPQEVFANGEVEGASVGLA